MAYARAEGLKRVEGQVLRRAQRVVDGQGPGEIRRRAAERQLASHKGHLQQNTAAPSGSAMTGQVARIMPGDDHAFILNNLGTQL